MNAMMAAELNQARLGLAKAKADVDRFARLCAILAKHFLDGTVPPMVDGSVGITRAAFDTVPNLYAINLVQGAVKPMDGDPNADPVDMYVIQLRKAPEKQILQVVGGA